MVRDDKVAEWLKAADMVAEWSTMAVGIVAV